MCGPAPGGAVPLVGNFPILAALSSGYAPPLLSFKALTPDPENGRLQKLYTSKPKGSTWDFAAIAQRRCKRPLSSEAALHHFSTCTFDAAVLPLGDRRRSSLQARDHCRDDDTHQGLGQVGPTSVISGKPRSH